MSAQQEGLNAHIQLAANETQADQTAVAVNTNRNYAPAPVYVRLPQQTMVPNNRIVVVSAPAANVNPPVVVISNPTNPVSNAQRSPNMQIAPLQIVSPQTQSIPSQTTTSSIAKPPGIVCIQKPSIGAATARHPPAPSVYPVLARSQYPGASPQIKTNACSAPMTKSKESTSSAAYPGASSTTRGVPVEEALPNVTMVPKDKKRDSCCEYFYKRVMGCWGCLLAICICCIIPGIAVPAFLLNLQKQFHTLDCLDGFESPFTAGLPVPGEEFEFCQNGILQKILLNQKARYFKPELTQRCVMEMDDEGDLDSSASYIEISDDYPETLEIDDVLLATADIFEDIHPNCTIFPAVIITEITDENNGILTLRIREAEMFEYIDEIDVNIANATTYDSGIDMGEIKRLRKMVEYLNNRSAEADADETGESVSFQNVNLTQMESECYREYENGTEEVLPITGGSCGDVSEVNYFGQQYGVDTVQFGSQSFTENDDTYGVDPIESERRRLGFKKWWRKFRKKVRRKVVKVVKKVVEIVEDVIEAVAGNIDMRVYEQAISIGPSDTFTVGGNAVKGSAAIGNFELNAGVDFYTGIYVDLEAKYQIIGEDGPSFDAFRLVFGGETRFRTYADIGVNGEVEIEYEVARREKIGRFFIGIVPVVVKPYASVSLGLTVDTPVGFSAVAEFGYEPIKIEFGVQWVKGEGFTEISDGFDAFKPYKNFGLQMDNQLCTGLEIKPYIKLQMGVVVYEAVDIFVAAKLSLISEFSSPEACNANRCGDDFTQTYFGLSLGFAFSIGYDIDASDIGLGSNGNELELFALETKPIFEDCLSYNMPSDTLAAWEHVDNKTCGTYCDILYICHMSSNLCPV